MKQNLNEWFIPEILERKTDNMREGVLCRVVYPICNIDKRNNNGRIYKRNVWEKVMADPQIKEKIANRCLYGHAEHPKESSQSDLEKTSHIITKMWIDEATNRVLQEIEVLDTFYGRLVNTLLTAGCKVGVSTRADGELVEERDDTGSYKNVIADSYKYFSTDTTADPSTTKPYPESVEFNLVKEIQSGIHNEKIDKAFAMSLLEKCQSKEACALLESIKTDVKLSEKSGKCIGCSEDKVLDKDGLCHECWADKNSVEECFIVWPKGVITQTVDEFMAISKFTQELAEAEGLFETESIAEKAPEGWDGTVKAMKSKGVKNPYALAWSMDKKGYKSHYKKSGAHKNEATMKENKEQMEVLNASGDNVYKGHNISVYDVLIPDETGTGQTKPKFIVDTKMDVHYDTVEAAKKYIDDMAAPAVADKAGESGSDIKPEPTTDDPNKLVADKEKEAKEAIEKLDIAGLKEYVEKLKATTATGNKLIDMALVSIIQMCEAAYSTKQPADKAAALKDEAASAAHDKAQEAIESAKWGDIKENADGEFRAYGRTYKTKVFNTPDEANKFLEANPSHGVIGEEGGKVHVAANFDKGIPRAKESAELIKVNADLLAENAILKAEIAHLKESQPELQNVAALRAEIIKLKEDTSSLVRNYSKDVLEFTHKINVFSSKYKELNEKIGALIVENETLVKTNTTLNAQVNEQSQLRTELEAAKTKLSESLQSTKVDIEKALTEAKAELVKEKESVKKQLLKKFYETKINCMGLKLPKNALTLLEHCKSEVEINTTIQELQDALREGAVHSTKLTEITAVNVNKPVNPEQSLLENKVGNVLDGMLGGGRK